MNYIKSYNVGQIKLNLPTPNYFNELPLLSFGDIHGRVDLAIIFNYGMSKEGNNPYNISSGFKLNLQKRIIVGSDGMPDKFQDENGISITLNGDSDVYSFEDDTQRVLRKDGSTYVLENLDYSKEIYDSTGKIISKYDKYGVLVLSYNYDDSNKLITITYRGEKTIFFVYNTSDCLSSIEYNNKLTTFSYTTNTLSVNHYSGVIFNLKYSSDNFSVSANDNLSATVYSIKIERPEDYWNRLKVSSFKDNEVIDEISYTFSNPIIDYPNTSIKYMVKYSQVEIVDKKGVKKRIQYQDGMPLYSYEVGDTGEYVEGDIKVFNTIDVLENTKVNGIFDAFSGLPMYVTNQTMQVWEHNACDYYDSSVEGYYIVTGWIRSKGNAISSSPIYITKGGEIEFQFTPDLSPRGQWKYFAYKFSINANFIKVFPDNTGFVELRDLRIIFKPTHIIDSSNGKRRIAISENVLVYHSGGSYDYIPIDEATFVCGDENISDYGKVYFEDILKYKLNAKKGVYNNEIYYNKCKKILLNSFNELKIMYNDTPCSLTSFYLGNRMYTPNGIVTSIFKDDNANFIVCETIDANGAVVSSQTIDDKLDIVNKVADGISTFYTRQNDLILSKNVNGLYKSLVTYGIDSSGCPTITTTDEFDNATVYTVDPIWGNVKSITLPDGVVISDGYDSDACTKLKRIFSPNGRSNIYEYSGRNISRVQSDVLFYDFIYSKDNLSAIKKNDAYIEEHEISDVQTNSYYPSKSGTVYSELAKFDKYGRLTSVDGVIAYTYKIDPFCVSGSYNSSDYDNASSKLAVITDHLTDEVIKFAYNEDKVEKAAIFNSSETKIGEISFSYDESDRVVSSEYVSEDETVSDTIVYATEAALVNSDERIGRYTFSVDAVIRVYSVNEYDNFKRLQSKAVTVGSNQISKTYSYNGTRLSGVACVTKKASVHNYSVGYDGNSRVVSDSDSISGGYSNSYSYDVYGQLSRENNESYGKTIIYTYDNIGNVVKAQKYSFTNGEVSGTATEDTYVYSTNHPDRLTSFNGKSITYDNNGCVKTYDGWTYSWDKGKLSSIDKSTLNRNSSTSRIFIGGTSSSYRFVYNARGQRIRKTYTYFPGSIHPMEYMTSSTTEYKYDLQGRLLSDIRTLKYNDGTVYIKKFVFLYEGSEIVGVIFTNSEGTGIYYYDKNIYGDVINILDNSGNIVVKYAYDAYGNCTRGYASNSDLADNNPIRYRSYYFDTDTELYYLNSRYYNPEWRRFISPDDTGYLDPDSVNGLNLYAYCLNNPVMYSDPYGTTAWWEWVGLVVLSIVAVGAIVAGTILSGGTAAVGFAGLAGSVLSGVGAGFLGGAATNLMLQGATNGWDFSAIDPMSAIKAGGIGAAIGGVGGFASYGIGQVGQLIGNYAGNYISSMTIAGLNVGKTFEYLGGASMITSLFSNIGRISGAILGSYIANDGMNRLFANQTTSRQNILDAFSGEMQSSIFGLVYKLCRWLI